jgi:hypothetical protein
VNDGEIIDNPKDIVFWIIYGEIERQNRSLLKRMQIARVEGQDWRKAVQTYLIAY